MHWRSLHIQYAAEISNHQWTVLALLDTVLLFCRVFGYLYFPIRLYGAITRSTVMQSSPFENFKPHIVTFSSADQPEVGRLGTIWKWCLPRTRFSTRKFTLRKIVSWNRFMSYFLHFCDNCFSKAPHSNGCSK